MNKKGESVQFVVIVSVALVIIGLLFIMFGKQQGITSQTTYTPNTCYVNFNGELTSADVSQCCAAIKQSTGCKPYTGKYSNEQLYLCAGSPDIVVDKDTIEFCER